MRMRHIDVICLVLLCLSTLSHNRHDFRIKVTEHKMCVLIFSTPLVWNIFYSRKKWARCGQKCILVVMWSARYSCQILVQPEFSRHIFEISLNTKFHKNQSSGSRVPWVQTYRNMTTVIVTSRRFANEANQISSRSSNQATCTLFSTLFNLYIGKVWTKFPTELLFGVFY